MNEPEMLWIDLETTGLDPELDVPLEVGLAVTTRWGTVIAEESWLIWEHPYDLTKSDKYRAEEFQRGVERGRANEYVNNMHTKSGLWDDLKAPDFDHEPGSRALVATLAMEWIQLQGIELGTLPMCGNSVGSLDRPMLRSHMPVLDACFHYRSIDITTFKETCRLVNPVLFEQIKPIVDDKGAAIHRVLDDIHASILEYQTYLREFIMVGD